MRMTLWSYTMLTDVARLRWAGSGELGQELALALGRAPAPRTRTRRRGEPAV